MAIAFSRDAGRTFGPPIRVDGDGTLGRMDVEMLDDGSALVSWIARSPGVAQFQMRRVEPSGSKSNAIGIATLAW